MAKVYVSSTRLDLESERKAVIDWLIQASHQPAHSYVADTLTVREGCLNDVRECDAYVLILGYRYGHVPHDGNPDQLSITELEYREARDHLPVVVLASKGARDVSVTDIGKPEYVKVEAFWTLVNLRHKAYLFADEAELIAGLSSGLQKALRGDPLADPDVQRVIALLSTQAAERIDALVRENRQLHAQLAAAVVRTLDAAAAPGAAPAQVEAAAALRASVRARSGEHRVAARLFGWQRKDRQCAPCPGRPARGIAGFRGQPRHRRASGLE